MEVGDSADYRREMNDMGTAVYRRQGYVHRPKVTGVDLAGLAHPFRRLTLIRYSDLERAVAQEPTNNGSADGSDAARDKYAAHSTAHLCREFNTASTPPP
ncbi:hypothetical protein MAGR_58570 [Mycolicibacterium agri]|uniref:Uncharacterized protein n=1 Tax=Mycolicibacterium agri TaxID=36811 RepID=A0A7I9WB25_MYCAG|nr:hypothetical protein MAGR_58570 [Mycolicibacterium agri]